MEELEKKAKAYDDVKEKIALRFGSNVAEEIFSEYEMNEDERIKKAILSGLNYLETELGWDAVGKVDILDMVDWLEKQGEQKDFASKQEPKFHEGQWIVWKDKYYKVNYNGCGYELVDQNGLSTSLEYGTVEESANLWTINDAKDGDVLSYVTDEEDSWIMIYMSLYEPYEGHVHYHALLVNDNFTGKGTCCISINDLKPTTKEQRDILFQKMKEAGYEWDAEKKEPKKIEKDLTEFESNMIQWKGNNLNEVIAFTGKDKNFDKWFKSFEEYEEYVHEHNDIFKLFNEDGSHYEVPVGAWIVKTPDGCKVASKSIFKNKSAEWSEEDIFKVQRICKYLDEAKKYYADITEVRECMDWLKSLKERIGWKPSEEQMEALTLAIHDVHEMWYKKHLLSLKQQLKQV